MSLSILMESPTVEEMSKHIILRQVQALDSRSLLEDDERIEWRAAGILMQTQNCASTVERRSERYRPADDHVKIRLTTIQKQTWWLALNLYLLAD